MEDEFEFHVVAKSGKSGGTEARRELRVCQEVPRHSKLKRGTMPMSSYLKYEEAGQSSRRRYSAIAT